MQIMQIMSVRTSIHRLIVQLIQLIAKSVNKLPDGQVVHLHDRLTTLVCSIGMVVRSVIIIQCVVEHVPHVRGEDRVVSHFIPVHPSDVIVVNVVI